MHLFKKDWRSIEKHIGTRTCSQIRSHAQKYFMKLEKKQQGRDCANRSGGDNSAKSSSGAQSFGGDDCEKMVTPQFKRMKSAAPAVESATKKHLRFRTDAVLLQEQEFSQSLLTQGATPDQQN